MTTELRGSGPVAMLMGTAAVRAKPRAPQSRFNLSARAQPFASSNRSSAPADEPETTAVAPVVTSLPPAVELSTSAWLQRLRIEKRIAPSNEEADAGAVAPTPASVYGVTGRVTVAGGFSAKG